MTTYSKIEIQRIEPLDSLRGIAAVLVMIYHLKFIFKLPIDSYSDFIISRLGLSVELFYVLSSFSIFYSLHGKEFSIQSMQSYFIRRFFRIAPLYYFLLIVFFFYNNQSLFSLQYLSNLFLNITFSFAFSPLHHEGLVPAGWSIGIEFLIYFVLPILFCLIRSVKSGIISLVVIYLISSILAYEYGSESYKGLSYSIKNLVVMLPFFFLGIMIFWIYMSSQIMNILSKCRYLLFISSLIGIALVYFFFYYQSHNDNMYGNFIKYSKLYVYIAMFCFLTVILLQLTKPIALLHNKFFNYAGKWSYSIYLIHPLVIFSSKPIYDYIYLVFPLTSISFCVCLLYTLIIVVGMSYISFRFIEETGIKKGKSIIEKFKLKK
ncbi:acyltransferase family protein [Flavobacterium denitrificans]|uniref:acyltransferase family protein n=1 Tax=Flavobacterium denitrificans TaxID=281361 RepID=UPI0003F5EE3D|nr:acyltransferase [Flavobacterium denitrificans]